MKVNMKKPVSEKSIGRLFRTLGQPTRLQILLAIGDGEACVCHLEVLLGKRQAYISQHLMALRKAKLLQSRREGRFVFYRLKDPKLLDLIRGAGEVMDPDGPGPLFLMEDRSAPDCVCPHCA
jgi:ArsR family transcriptional regulator